jgi:hypothetical protein
MHIRGPGSYTALYGRRLFIRYKRLAKQSAQDLATPIGEKTTLTARIYSINNPNATARLTITHCWLFHKPFHPVIPSAEPTPSFSCCGKKLLASSFASSEPARERLRKGIVIESRKPMRVYSVCNRQAYQKRSRTRKASTRSLHTSEKPSIPRENPEREDAVGCLQKRHDTAFVDSLKHTRKTRYVSRERGVRAKTAEIGNVFLGTGEDVSLQRTSSEKRAKKARLGV